jgi:hypothetical protein
LNLSDHYCFKYSGTSLSRHLQEDTYLLRTTHFSPVGHFHLVSVGHLTAFLSPKGVLNREVLLYLLSPKGVLNREVLLYLLSPKGVLNRGSTVPSQSQGCP